MTIVKELLDFAINVDWYIRNMTEILAKDLMH